MIQNQDKYTRWWDALAAFFLLLALQTAASRLVATGWTRDLSIVQSLTFFGLVTGLAIGYSTFSPQIAVLLATAYGGFAISLQLGNLLREDLLWLERMTILTNRLEIILYQIVHREVLSDSLLFLVIMSLVFWVLSVWGGYSMVRYGRSWEAVGLAGICIIVIHAFDPLVFRRGLYLVAFFIFSLIFVARMIFFRFRTHWEANRTALPPQLGWNFFRFTIVAVVLIVLFAWTLPGMANAAPVAQRAWKPVLQVWEKARLEIEGIFAPLKSTAMAVMSFYGDATPLGKGIPHSDNQVFSVEVPGDIPPGVRLYWRARVYDFFENGQWLSTIGNTVRFDPQRTNLRARIYYGRWPGSFKFTVASSISTLFIPPNPLWTNQDGWVEYTEAPDGSVDISTFRADPPVDLGQEYRAQSAVNYASEAQLRSASVDYPDWILEQYLQLPKTVTPRMLELAKSLTQNEPTVYDKTVAVTNYLRNNFTYSETIEANIPSDADIIDWFLFDYRKGFCNYYSTAEIILLRAVGIPARWAIGYAQGDQLEGDRTGGQPTRERITYLVRQKDAHAWPEVFFPNIGWVEFEPTASQPEIVRLPGDQVAANQDPLSNQLDAFSSKDMENNLAELLKERNLLPTGSQMDARRSYRVYLFVLGLVAILGAIFWLNRAGWLFISWRGGTVYLRWRDGRQVSIQPLPRMIENTLRKFGLQPPETLKLMSRRASLSPVSKAYLQINLALKKIGAEARPNETPSERAECLSALIPETEKAAKRLVKEYHLATFSQKPANSVIAWTAAAEIRDLAKKGFSKRLQVK